MSREYNYGGTSLIVDSIEEIFESGAVSTKTVNNIKQIIGQQRQSKDINKLKEQIGGAAEDGTISASEKPGLTREWASLESSYATISNKFEQDENLSDNTFFYLLKANYEALSPIMGEILADMNSDYTNKEKVAKITDLFVACWDYISKCSKYIEDRMSISDRFSIQVSANREIVSSLSISLKLLCYIDGSYIDVTYNEAYADSDFVWRKASDENFSRTGRTLNLTLADFSKEEESFLVTFRHVSHYQDANNTEFVVEKSLDFSVRTGTLSQWAWSDAATKEELLMDPLVVWLDYRREFNTKKYLWRRDTDDLLKADSEKEWTYFRESGLDGLVGSNGYSRAVLELFKRSETTPASFDGGVITYTFSTNAISGDTGTWQKTIPNGEHPLYIIKATAFANTETDAISTGEWTTPAILSEHGTDGATGATAFSLVLYQRSESSPSKPSNIVTYNIKTGAITGNGNWSLSFPSSNGYPCWAINATAFSYTDTDEILPSEWSDVQKLVEDGKDGESAIQPLYQWRLSVSSTVPPTDTTVYMVNGSATFYNGALLVNAVDGWVYTIPTPTPDHPYIWQRISNDNGLTWGEPFCLSINTVEYLEVSCKPQFYTLNDRGVNDKEQAIDVTIDRTFIPIENPCYIKVSTHKDDAIVDTGEWREHNASSTYRIQIPMHITYDRIIVEVSCGTLNKAISIDAVIDESKKGEKQLGIVYLNQNKIYKDSMFTQEITHLNDNPAMPFIDGDYALVLIGEDLIPYRFTDDVWTAISSDVTTSQDYANIMLDTLVDVLNSNIDVKATMKAHYAFIGQLAAQTATIEKIFSKHIRVLDGGSIYAGGFDENGDNKTNTQGFHLSSNGNLQAVGATLNSVTVNGSVACYDDNGDVLKTSYGSTGASFACSAKSRWCHADLYSSLSVGSSGPGSYAGSNYNYKRTNSSNSLAIIAIPAGNTTDSEDTYGRFTAQMPMTIRYTLPSVKANYVRCYTFIAKNTYGEDGYEYIKSDDGTTKTGTMTLKTGDRIVIGTNVGDKANSGTLLVEYYDDTVVIFGSDNVPVKTFRNEQKFESTSISLGSFSSSSNLKYAPTTGWLSIPSGGVANSSVKINGASYQINSASKVGSSLVLLATSGASFSFVAPDNSEVATSGWYDIEGTLVSVSEARGVKTESLYPVNPNTTQIGTDEKRFTGFFSGVNVTGNVIATKVWGAVFN